MDHRALIPILAIPGVVWIISYLLLVREFGRWDLFDVEVHESGRYTLLQTVFYYSHFLRELPLDTLFASAILWSYAAAGIHFPAFLEIPFWTVLFLGLFLAFVVSGSIRSVGLKLSWQDLTQFRETDIRAARGSHWQMHFLSTAVILIVLMLPGVLFGRPGTLVFQGLALAAVFVGLSIALRCGATAVTNARWVLHGAREVLTYFVLIALPLFSPLLMRGVVSQMHPTPLSGVLLVCLAGAAAYFWIVYRRSNLSAEASSNRGLAFLLSSHFFEHTLDFVYILLFILAIGSL